MIGVIGGFSASQVVARIRRISSLLRRRHLGFLGEFRLDHARGHHGLQRARPGRGQEITPE